MILLIDNYDSFVFNLARYFKRLGQETCVVRNDAITAAEITQRAPAALVFSPGPCGPEEAGQSISIIREHYRQIPMLGVCLGHQAIAAAFGGSIVRAAEPMHGQASRVYHDGQSIFAQAPNPFPAARYHSLVVDPATLPTCLGVTAHTEDGTIMGIAHREFPIVGVQFHPESILTESGYDLLAEFLVLAGLGIPHDRPHFDDELTPNRPTSSPLPATPITF